MEDKWYLYERAQSKVCKSMPIGIIYDISRTKPNWIAAMQCILQQNQLLVLFAIIDVWRGEA